MSTSAQFDGVGMDLHGHLSVVVRLTIDPEELVLHAGFDVVVRRADVEEVRVRWPRPWEAMPLAPLLAVRTRQTPRRWRRLFRGPGFTSPRPLAAALRDNGWPV